MGIRTNVDVTVQVGRNNDLAQVAFDGGFQQLLDTLEHEESGTFTLDPAESNFSIPFGDVGQARMVYLEADGPIRVTPGGGIATQAQRDGVAGSYPTGFTGVAENLDLEIDGTPVTVDFASGDQSLAQVINRINAAAALAGITGPGGVPATIARNTGGSQLRLISPTTGTGSSVEVLSSSAAAVLTALGLVAGITLGVNSTPGQTPLTLMKPANTTASDRAAGVKSYLLATLMTATLVVENLDPDNAVEVAFLVAGDLVTSPPGDC
jgi:hypothetical protein